MPRRLVIVSLAALFVAAAAAAWWAGGRARALTDLAQRLLVEREDAARSFVRLYSVAGKSQLVVAESQTVVSGAYESSKAVLGVDLGTTALTYEVPVRYLYAVDLGGEAPIRFTLDPDTATLWAQFPALTLAAAEPDLGRLEQQLAVGWGRLARYSGEDVRRRFRERVMSDIRARGADPATLVAVRAPARAKLVELTRSFLAAYAPEAADRVARVEVRFADEAPAERGR